ncbi:MAG: type III pantothenate kinase [Omnitrophica bacterium]|nr:type III pantothenate kinase [Candidatus Omnitrophota bacterium]
MILAIDIGNTNVDFALMSKTGKIKERFSCPSKDKASLARVIAKIKKKQKPDKIIVVSVAPGALKAVKSYLKKHLPKIPLSVVGSNVSVPLKCEYNKKEVGQDRLVTAYAAKLLYGSPVLIVDFGTAVTFDAVSKKGAYLGGLILPGIKMSLTSLSENTSMLPRTVLKEPRTLIAKNTVSSIRAGMIYGYASMCEGLVKLFKKKLGKSLKVVATGGDAPIIKRHTKSLKKVDLNLSIKGLHLLAIKGQR